MIKHIVMWKFKPGTEKEMHEFLDGISLFESMADLDAYKSDPRHVAVSAKCKAIRTDRVAVDWEV